MHPWIDHAAAVLSGTWGAVSRRAQQSGSSRTTLSQHAQRVVQAVFHEQVGGISSETLWEDNERLRAEHAALWQAWAEAEALREAQQRAFASASGAMGLSLTQIVTLLAIVLPAGDRWAEVITRWPCLEHVLTDGVKGLERGVKVANDTRQAQVQAPALTSTPPITMSLAVFHPQCELERVWHRQWGQAESQLEVASETDATADQSKQRGRDARGVAGQSWRAWYKAERLFDEAVQGSSDATPPTHELPIPAEAAHVTIACFLQERLYLRLYEALGPKYKSYPKHP